MLITNIKEKKDGMYAVYVDNNYAFSLIGQDIKYFKISINNDISQELYNFIIENTIYIKAQDIALKYIGYKMRTENEVRDKLLKSGYNSDVIEKVMDFLIKYNYVNDYEYCMAFIRQCLKLNPLGKYGIKQKLKFYGVSDDIIESAVYDSDIDEEFYAKELLNKKMSKKEFLESDLKKLQYFLLRRGFSYDIIKEVLNDYKKTER